MQNKLKAQAKKMRGAADVAAAAAAFREAGSKRAAADGIEDESRQDGLLIDTAQDEEAPLHDVRHDVSGVDENLFADLPDDDPLVVERQRLAKAQQGLDKYLKERADAKGKPSPQEEAMKASLQKALLAQQIRFKEEAKKAQAVERELQK